MLAARGSGSLGTILVIALVIALLMFFLRRPRSRAPASVTAQEAKKTTWMLCGWLRDDHDRVKKMMGHLDGTTERAGRRAPTSASGWYIT